MSMRVIPPVLVTGTMLTATSVPEVAPALYAGGTTYALNATASVAGAAGTGLLTVYKSIQAANTGHTPASSPLWWQNIGDTYQVYSGGATYASGERVIDSANHLQYRSLVAANTGNALTDATKWFAEGSTNARRMFDLKRSNPTVVPVPLVFSFTPNARIDSFAMLGMSATSATLTMTVGASTVYTVTQNLDLRIVTDWYSYFFEPFDTEKSMIRFDLPPYSGATVTVTLTNANGSVALAAVVVGMAVTLGIVARGAEDDVLNFSTVVRDSSGVATMTPERNVPKTISSISFPSEWTKKIRYVREQLNAEVAVWAGVEDQEENYFESLLILGFYRRFSINLSSVDDATIGLELEEV